MKKLLLILFLIPLNLFAPTHEEITIPAGVKIEPYEALIEAVVMVESGGDVMAYNRKENAVGCFQVRPIRLKDYNLRTGSHYKLSDMYDYEKAKKVFLYYCQGDYETIAKSWNGSGKQTEIYWGKIQKYLL